MGKTRKDLAWEHGESLPNNSSKCCYCAKVLKSGGVTRLKQHLAGKGNQVVACTACPKEVRAEMKRLLSGWYEDVAAKRNRDFELRDALSRPAHIDDPIDPNEIPTPIDDMDDQAMKRSRIDRYLSNGELNAHVALGHMPNKKEGPFDPYALRWESARQPTVKSMWGNSKERYHIAVLRWFHFSGIPPNVANNPYFVTMFDECARAGPGVRPPSTYEIMTNLLDKE
ncbi:hypothetical protein FRX31_007691, partial [Thalictrum thalictroides]